MIERAKSFPLLTTSRGLPAVVGSHFYLTADKAQREQRWELMICLELEEEEEGRRAATCFADQGHKLRGGLTA